MLDLHLSMMPISSRRCLYPLLLFVLLAHYNAVVVNAFSTMGTTPSGDHQQRTTTLPHLSFPTSSTTPSEVLEAQLCALQDNDLMMTYQLFSRARRLVIDDAARIDMRQTNLPKERIVGVVQQLLDTECPDLVDHAHHTIVSAAEDPLPEKGRLPTTVCRVGVQQGSLSSSSASSRQKYYLVTLTRQSMYDGGDPRDEDGFERCWFVWSIQLEDGGGGRDDTEGALPPPGDQTTTSRGRTPVLC